jgi:hypothetical protein
MVLVMQACLVRHMEWVGTLPTPMPSWQMAGAQLEAVPLEQALLLTPVSR